MKNLFVVSLGICLLAAGCGTNVDTSSASVVNPGAIMQEGVYSVEVPKSTLVINQGAVAYTTAPQDGVLIL